MDAFLVHMIYFLLLTHSEYTGIFLFEFMVTCTKYMLCLYCLGAFILTDDYANIIFFCVDCAFKVLKTY
jgi:hypothetical protein